MATSLRVSQGADDARECIATALDEPPTDESPYLTDGVHLFRLLGAFSGGDSALLGLEDCRSLSVILVSAEDLRDAGLRSVARTGSST